jgi:hypothetical protein
MKNRQFETTLNSIRNRYNAILLRRSVLKSALIILLVFNLYMTIRWFLKSPSEIILLANTFRIAGLLALAYVVYINYKLRPDWLKVTRWLDEMHGTKDDLYQNILELHSDKTVAESAIYHRLYDLGSERISSQKVTYPATLSPLFKRIVLIISGQSGSTLGD